MAKNLSVEDGSGIDDVFQRLKDLRAILRTGRDLKGNKVQVTGMFPVVVKDLEQQLGRLVFEALETKDAAS